MPKRSASQGGKSKTAPFYDVIVVGAGPAGSVTGWRMAQNGAKVLVLDRSRFPREKVCGDFVEPRGLRILDKMGCLKALTESPRQPITRVAIYLESVRSYRGRIPFYGQRTGLPPHGYIIPREDLDQAMLQRAVKAGAELHEESHVQSVLNDREGARVQVARVGESRRTIYRAKLVVGADGANSVVAKCFGLLNYDRRHIAVSQRGYLEGLKNPRGECAFFFDHDLFPGYGWMFPMAGGKANIGVGVLAEARDRYRISVPQLFASFVEKLRQAYPKSSSLRFCRQPIGGIVKTYGAATKNYFDRGILVGDAGAFVDPMTGEGITPAMESALIGSSILATALESGRFGAKSLASYQDEFRRYFSPAMNYVDLCAAIMRNRAFATLWLRAVARGCELAQRDSSYAHAVGATFGGMEVDPWGILAQIWMKSAEGLSGAGLKGLLDLSAGDLRSLSTSMHEVLGWQLVWWQSFASDPVWHARWTSDVLQKWIRVYSNASPEADPRSTGLL